MGIDIYVDRVDTAPAQQVQTAQTNEQAQRAQQQPQQSSPEKSIKSVAAAIPAIPATNITIQQLAQSRLFADVCCYFSVEASSCQIESGNRLEFNGIQWIFDLQAKKPTLTGNVMISTVPSHLTNTADKKALWQGFWQLSEQVQK